MDQLTALERELLRSVEALTRSSGEEVSGLRKALRRYADETSDGIEQRLKAIEERQRDVEALLNGLSERLDGFAEQLQRSEGSANALSEELRRFGS